MTSEAMRHLVSCIGKRKRLDSSGRYEVSSLLVDSHSAHKTDAVKDMCDQYNIHLHIIDNGLKSRAQMADYLYIREHKREVAKRQLALRQLKYRQAKERLQDAQGVVQGHVQLPKLTLVELLQILIQAWKATDLSKVHQKWVDIRMVPHALAKKNWLDTRGCIQRLRS